MKSELKIRGGEYYLEIVPESDIEEIALKAWADKFFYTPQRVNGAYLVCKTQYKPENSP